MRWHILIGILTFTFVLVLGGLLLLKRAGSQEQMIAAPQRSAQVTVFVHGSVYTALSLLNPQQVLADDLSEDSWYVSLIKQIRKNPGLWDDQPLLEEGFCEISPEMIAQAQQGGLPVEEKRKAAYFVAATYHELLQHSQKKDTESLYFTFGHLGLLSCKYRHDAARELYVNLANLNEQLKKTFAHITYTIVCHSHGGNILLHLAEHEAHYQRNLSIDNLVMFGTPIQVETASLVNSHIFKRVINCYSDGDYVQSADTFSTKVRRSYKAFSDERLNLESLGDHVYDVRLLANDDALLIDHINMWFLGKSRKASRALYPLPIMVLTPVLLQMLDSHSGCTVVDCHIDEDDEQFHVRLCAKKRAGVLGASHNLSEHITQLKNIVIRGWDTSNHSNAVIFCKKTFQTLYHAYRAVCAA